MKKLFLLLLLIPAGVSAEEVRINDLSGGMFSYYSDNKIPDNTAHSIKNMYTDQEAMAVQRNGYVAFKNGVTGFNIPGMWRFTDTTQTEWLVWFSSKSVFGYSGQISTSTVFQFASTNIPDCTTNLGRFWCTNGSDDLAWWDGVSSGTVPSAPHGSLIASWRNRIVLANIPSSISTMRFSADGDGTLWTLGINPTDPFSRQIGGANDGYAINCLRGSYYDNIIVGRKYDLWYGSGFDSSDLGFRNISQEVGCLQSPKMQEFDGSLMFLSWRGIEQMTGTQIQLVSEPIRDLVDPIVKNASNGPVSNRSLTLTGSTSWNAGTFTGNLFFVDTVTISGWIQPTFPDDFAGFMRDGTGGTKNVWNLIDYSTITTGTFTETLAPFNGLIYTSNGGTMTSGTHNGYMIQTSSGLNPLTTGTTYVFQIVSMTPDAVQSPRWTIALSSRSLTSGDGGNLQNTSRDFYYTFESTSSGVLHLLSAGVNGNATPYNSLFTSTFPAIVYLYTTATTFNLSVNGINLGSGSHTFGAIANSPYAYMVFSAAPGTGHSTTIQVGGAGGVGGPVGANNLGFNVIPETFTFTSAAQTISSNISKWDTFSINGFSVSGFTMGIRSAPTDAYTTIFNGQTPTISTSTYWQFRSTFSSTEGLYLTPLNGFYGSSNQPGLNIVTQKWLEGNTPPLASMVYDRRYWLSYAENLNVTPAVNDNTLVFQRNHTWTKFTFGAASYALWKNNLYFGDSTTGSNVFLFDSGTTDNGAAINAEIIFKSLDLGLPSHEKSFRNLWMSYLGDTSYTGTITVSANADRGSYASLGTAGLNESTGQALAKFPFTLTNGIPERGREIQIKVSKNVSGDKLKLYDLVLELYPKEAR